MIRHDRGRESTAVSLSKHQYSGISHAAKGGPAICKTPEYALDTPTTSPMDASPRSPVDSFVRFDSTSSTSRSLVVPENHTSAHNATKMQTHYKTTEGNSTSACLVPSLSRELPSNNVCLKRASLEQHLRLTEVDCEENTQSFILKRFLAAARTVAADHDRSMYSLGKPSGMSAFLTSSSTAKMPVDASPSELYTSGNFPNECLSCHNQSNDDGSVDTEMLANSCGFTWAGLRSAMSCTHNTAYAAPSRDLMTEKSMARLSSSQTRSFLKDDSRRTVNNEATKGTQKQRGTFMPDLKGNTTSPSAQNAPPRMISSVVGSHNDHSGEEKSHLCLQCDVTSNQQNTETFRRICLTDVAPSLLALDTQQTSEESNPNAECPVSENVLMNLVFPVTAVDDDELEFHDAASSFVELSWAETNNSSSQESNLANCQDLSLSAQLTSSDVSMMCEAHLPSTKAKETLIFDSAFDSAHEDHVDIDQKEQMKREIKERLIILTPALTSRSNSRCDSQHNSSGCAEIVNGASLNSNQKDTAHSYESFSASSLPGWPFGISSLQSGPNKSLLHETEYTHDTYNAKSQFAKAAVEQLRHDSKFSEHLYIRSTNRADEGTKLGKTADHKKTLPAEMLCPPVPPSPTTSSWLGKALALKASKPLYLTRLQQQQQNLISVQKKQEFNLSPDEKRRVKWEDMVKGSQVHPDCFCISEVAKGYICVDLDSKEQI